MKNLDEFSSFILEQYQAGNTLEKISILLGCSRNLVSKNLRAQLKVSRIVPLGIPNTYFDTIDSKEKAYILGFIAADGALVQQNNNLILTITIKYTDKSVLEFIRNQISPTSNLTEIKRVSSFDINKQIHHIRFAYCNKHLSSKIISYGITPRKSLTIQNIIPNIPKEYRGAFLIGYFDGDGSISLPKSRLKFKKSLNTFVEYPSHRLIINMRGTKEFLQGIVNEFNFHNNIYKFDSTASLSLGDKEDVVKFFKLYNGMSFFLERKYNKFFPRINHSSYDIYK